MDFSPFLTYPTTYLGAALHAHEDFEAHYVISGSGHFRLGSKRSMLRAGDFFLVPPDEPHSVGASEGTILTQIFFTFHTAPNESPFRNDLQAHFGKGPIFAIGKHRSYFFETLRKNANSQDPVRQRSAAATWIQFLYDLILSRSPDATADHKHGSDVLSELLRAMYLNLRGSFSVKAEARRLGKSEVWINRSFRRALGVPPLRHYLRLKIDAAAEMLLAKGMTVTQVAEAFGFPDVFYFSKLFKKFRGHPPVELIRKRAP